MYKPFRENGNFCYLYTFYSCVKLAFYMYNVLTVEPPVIIKLLLEAHES